MNLHRKYVQKKAKQTSSTKYGVKWNVQKRRRNGQRNNILKRMHLYSAPFWRPRRWNLRRMIAKKMLNSGSTQKRTTKLVLSILKQHQNILWSITTIGDANSQRFRVCKIRFDQTQNLFDFLNTLHFYFVLFLHRVFAI